MLTSNNDSRKILSLAIISRNALENRVYNRNLPYTIQSALYCASLLTRLGSKETGRRWGLWRIPDRPGAEGARLPCRTKRQKGDRNSQAKGQSVTAEPQTALFLFPSGGTFRTLSVCRVDLEGTGRKRYLLDIFAIINDVILAIDGVIWGPPLIALILIGGIFLTIRLHGMQFRRLPIAMRYAFSNEEDGEGELSSFAALCTAMSATVGTGNIVGIATAVVTGGPGALFWMWLAALFGMATKFSEGLLAVKYRTMDKNGHVLGGPFYYIENGMGPKWKWLAKLFAFFGMCVGLFGIGTFTQVNSISSAVSGFFDPNLEHTVSLFGGEYSIAVVIGGLVTAVLAGLVIIGGIKRIASVAERVVPAMVVLFLAFSCLLIIFNITKIPAALVTIVSSAFGLQAFGGGMFGAILIAMQMGLARGIFANEAGLGSAPIAAAAAQTKEPARQGLVSMTQTFIDSMIICSMTGLALVLTGTYNIGLEGAAVTTHAFQAGLPFLPPAVVSFVLMISLALFGFTTILGWDYYGERCLEYFSGRSKRAVMTYRWLYIFCLFIGPYMTVSAVWTIADIFNACMAVPNMIALFALSGVTAKELRNYFKRLDAANGDEEKMAPRPDDTEDWKSPKPQGAFGTVGVAQNFPCEE